MPKINVEITRTVTITRDQSVIVELDVPQEILDDDEVIDFVIQLTEGDDDNALSEEDRAQRKAIVEAEWDTSNEDAETEYDEAYEVH